jgi:hypothetical protein
MSPFVSLAVAALLLPQPPDDSGLRAENDRLRSRLNRLEKQLDERDEAIADVGRRLSAMAADVSEVRERLVAPAGVFMTGPPPSSDTVGVAKTVVFAPRVEVDSGRRRDIVFLRVKRVEPGRLQPVADVELGNDGLVVLPLDQNGALYVVDWSTSEGHTYDLMLRDGASGQAVATVQIRPQQSAGRFVFVGYRFE